jgi:hypothetical protein
MPNPEHKQDFKMKYMICIRNCKKSIKHTLDALLIYVLQLIPLHHLSALVLFHIRPWFAFLMLTASLNKPCFSLFFSFSLSIYNYIYIYIHIFIHIYIYIIYVAK